MNDPALVVTAEGVDEVVVWWHIRAFFLGPFRSENIGLENPEIFLLGRDG